MTSVLNFQDISGDGFPVKTEYVDTIENTILLQADGVTLFQGCKLHLDARDDVWMSPVGMSESDHESYFNVLYVGTTPESTAVNETLPVYFSYADEVDLKLSGDMDGPSRDLTDLLLRDEKSIVIRKSKSGMPYYPQSIVPDHVDAEVLKAQVEKLTTILGIADPEFIEPTTNEQTGDGVVRTVNGKDLYAYEIILSDDPWKYYNVFAARALDDIGQEDVLVRIDSCCEIGQVYNDNGCDCREQFHTAIEAIQDARDGLIVHVPAQDGRGYGSSAIMKIVGIERGDFPDEAIEGATDGVGISAVLLGDRYDNRTYGGVGRILRQLGIRSVILQTDNRLKVEGVESAGITVARKATGTTGANGSIAGVQAKHEKTGNYLKSEL